MHLIFKVLKKCTFFHTVEKQAQYKGINNLVLRSLSWRTCFFLFCPIAVGAFVSFCTVRPYLKIQSPPAADLCSQKQCQLLSQLETGGKEGMQLNSEKMVSELSDGEMPLFS